MINIKLLPFFCFHDFKETNIDTCTPALFCKHCGKVKSLPKKHKWEETGVSYEGAIRDREGKISRWTHKNIHLKCSVCGEITKRVL